MTRTRGWLPKAAAPAALLVACGLILRAAPETRDTSAGTGREAPQAAPGAPGPRGLERREPSPEYRGVGSPLEARDLELPIRLAEDAIQAANWPRALSHLDEALEQITAPPGRVRKRPARDASTAGAAIGRGQVQVREGGLAIGGLGVPNGAPPEPALDFAPREALLSRDGILYIPAAQAIERRLRDLPQEARELHERTYEAPARQALEVALALPPQQAISALVRLAQRYPLTPTGGTALELAAHRSLGSGKAGLAAELFDARISSALPLEPPRRASLLALAALAHARAGRGDSARERLATAARELPDGVIPIAGEPVAARDLPSQPLFAAALAASGSTAPECWDGGWNGSAAHDRSHLPVALEEQLGSFARWIHRIAPDAPLDKNAAQHYSPPPLPATLGTRVFVRTADGLVAIDARSGKKLWVASPEDLAAGSEPAHGNRQRNLMYSQAVRLDSVQVAPRATPGGRDLVLVLPAGGLQPESDESGLPAPRPNLLAAYDASSGKLVWTLRTPDGEWDPLRGLVFSALPVAVHDLLVCPGLRQDSAYAVAISRDGKIRWATRLHGVSYGQSFRYGSSLQGGMVQLAASNEVVAIADGLGLATALEPATGKVRWSTRYRTTLQGSQRPYRPNGRPPIIAGGTILIQPADSDRLSALEASSGKLLWEVEFSSSRGEELLGAAGGRVFLNAEQITARDLATGKELWRSPSLVEHFQRRPASQGGERFAAELDDPAFDEAFPNRFWSRPGGTVASGALVLEGRLFVATQIGILTSLDVADGSIRSQVRLTDPRLQVLEPLSWAVAGGEVLGATATRVFVLERQDATWKSTGENDTLHLDRRVRLLRSEGKFEEALGAIEAQLAGLKSPELVGRLEKLLVQTARLAAIAGKKPELLRRVIDHPRGLVRSRAERLELELLEARLLADGGQSLEAGRQLLRLAQASGVLAECPAGYEVDVGTYAANVLLELPLTREDLRTLTAGVTAPEPAPEATRRQVERLASAALLRRPHAPNAASVARRLLESPDRGSEELLVRAVERLRPQGDGSPPPDPPAERPPFDPVAPGLDAVLAAARGSPRHKLSSAFWIPAEEGYLAETTPGSEPLPFVAAICKQSLRLYAADGSPLVERTLPEFPDVTELKLKIEAGFEEPASVALRDGRLLLGAATGIYAFRGLPAPGAPFRARDLAIAWAQTVPHPMIADPSFREQRWGVISMESRSFWFPEVDLDATEPLLLERTGLRALEARSGKTLWKVPLDAPVHGNLLRPRPGPWREIPLAGEKTLALLKVSPGDGKKSRPLHRQVPLASPFQVRLLCGGLAVSCLSEDQTLVCMEAATGRPLWSQKNGGEVAFSTEDEVWVSSQRSLVARALRTGKEVRRIELPRLGAVIAAYPEGTAPDGSAAWTLLVSQYGNAYATQNYYGGRTHTGQGLGVVRISERGAKLWEVELERGRVTFGGARLRASDGRFVLVWNGEVDGAKWYTRAAVVDPAGAVEELLSVELRAKGTGLPPRLAVLRDGLALGNADGFGWFAPKAPLEPEKGANPATEPLESSPSQGDKREKKEEKKEKKDGDQAR